VPYEVGANPVGVTTAEIYRNLLNDTGYLMQGTSPSLDNILHDLDLALWRMRPQSARDGFEAPYGTSFTVAACTTVKGSASVTTTNNFLTAGTGVAVGTLVTGTGIPIGTFVKPGFSATGLSLSQPATAAGTVTLTFYPPSVGETVPRTSVTSETLAMATAGTLMMSAIDLPVNATISNLWFPPGTTGDAGPTTGAWMALYDSGRNLLATSAASTTAIVASTPFAFPIATVAAGAATSFTTTYSGLYYIGLVLNTTNAPTLCAQVSFAATNAFVPILGGTSTAGLTAPSTFPTTAGAITATANRYYFYAT
jgi:hypothetical protein